MGLADICRIGTLKFSALVLCRKCTKFYAFEIQCIVCVGNVPNSTHFKFSPTFIRLRSTKYSLKKKLRSKRSARKEKKKILCKALTGDSEYTYYFSYMLMTHHDSSHSASFTPSSTTVFLVIRSRVSLQPVSLPIPPFKIPLDFCVEKCPCTFPKVHWSFDFTSMEFCQKNASKVY